MTFSEMIVLSKLTPPQPHRPIFQFPRLQIKLGESYKFPLTIVHAGTGFGKTTTLISLSQLYPRTFWYNITEPDRDPTLFIAHLISAFLPESQNLTERLRKGGYNAAPAVLNLLINQLTTDLEDDAILILDDYHLVSDVHDVRDWFETLVEQRPPRLHIAIACRQIPETPAFIRWRVKGNVLVIDQSNLSLSDQEISSLFTDHHHFPISEEQTQTLSSYTEGWIIALEMVWQRLQTSRSKRLDHILAELPLALSDIFTFLAQEVLMRQPESIQNFLKSSSILREMEAAVCNDLLHIEDSQIILESLNDRGLFISTVNNERFRFQRLFQDFLLDQVSQIPGRLEELHTQAAHIYRQKNELEEAIFHLLAAHQEQAAAILIEQVGPRLLELGRLRTLSKWIEQMPEEVLTSQPALYLILGDVQRLRSRFENAITQYNQAEKIYLQKRDARGRSHALRSKAQVYLDTIRPLKATSLLEEAISLLEPQEFPSEVSELLDQLAENKLNLGQPQEAHDLHKEARLLKSETDPNDIYLEARSLLRTGRLFEARDLLDIASTPDPQDTFKRPQRFHREMSLLQALIHLMLGNTEKGEYYSRQGIQIGQQLDSPFVEAVGWMRLGHAFQLHPHLPWRMDRLDQAKTFYERSIELVKPFNVMRVQVEPLWGLCRYYGYQNQLEEARRLADQAIEISTTAGDNWFVALLNTTLGTSYLLGGSANLAQSHLQEAISGFEQVGDFFGEITASLHTVLNHWLYDSKQLAIQQFSEVLPRLNQAGLSFLLTRPSHLGLQNPLLLWPVLLEAHKQGLEHDWLPSFLKEKGLEGTNFHPGYGLKIRCLGPFEVWRNNTAINSRDWQREKARHLFQYFIGNRDKWFSRDQIADQLWSQLDSDGATQNLKVALNALNRALEPEREPGTNPFFITRRETLYGLNPVAEIHLDVDDFINLSSSSLDKDLEQALSIYQGDFLMENPDDHWAVEIREQLRETFLNTALRLSQIYFQQERWDEAIRISHEILRTDACNEFAFQMLMRCHAARGNRTTVHAVYQRCVAILRDDLDVEPAPETTQLWEKLTKV